MLAILIPQLGSPGNLVNKAKEKKKEQEGGRAEIGFSGKAIGDHDETKFRANLSFLKWQAAFRGHLRLCPPLLSWWIR